MGKEQPLSGSSRERKSEEGIPSVRGVRSRKESGKRVGIIFLFEKRNSNRMLDGRGAFLWEGQATNVGWEGRGVGMELGGKKRKIENVAIISFKKGEEGPRFLDIRGGGHVRNL